jgi:hypothetical protein
VEARAAKAERALAQAHVQLHRLEDALKARGVTLDYLLKQQTPVSVAGRAPALDRSSKASSARTKAVASASKDPTRSKLMTKARTSAKRPTRRRSNNDDDE